MLSPIMIEARLGGPVLIRPPVIVDFRPAGMCFALFRPRNRAKAAFKR